MVVGNSINEDFKYGKLSSVCTDGAPAMCGQKTGLVGELGKTISVVPVHHCITHQETLCAKSARLHPVMKFITEMVNFIRGGARALNSQKIQKYLSRGKCCLSRFVTFL